MMRPEVNIVACCSLVYRGAWLGLGFTHPLLYLLRAESQTVAFKHFYYENEELSAGHMPAV